jgi:hypothetical protein
LKDSLGAAFLDSRYELNNAIAPGKGGNPVPDLFSKRLDAIVSNHEQSIAWIAETDREPVCEFH